MLSWPSVKENRPSGETHSVSGSPHWRQSVDEVLRFTWVHDVKKLHRAVLKEDKNDKKTPIITLANLNQLPKSHNLTHVSPMMFRLS